MDKAIFEASFYLDEHDHLTYQLYVASVSPSIRGSRKKTYVITLVLLLGIGVYCYYREIDAFSFSFLLTFLIVLFFYPMYMRRYYRLHYLKSVREIYGATFGKEVEIKLGEETIAGGNEDGYSQIKCTTLTEIVETQEHVFLKLSTGPSLIIPKGRINNMEQLHELLHHYQQSLGITYHKILDWKWK